MVVVVVVEGRRRRRRRRAEVPSVSMREAGRPACYFPFLGLILLVVS